VNDLSDEFVQGPGLASPMLLESLQDQATQLLGLFQKAACPRLFVIQGFNNLGCNRILFLGREARETPGMLAEPAPSVSWEPGFGDSSLGLSLNYSVTDFASQYNVRTQLRRRIFERFREERIQMPYPTRTVFLHEGRPATDGAGERGAGA
jgi:small-conductance mechanosensitive channel